MRLWSRRRFWFWITIRRLLPRSSTHPDDALGPYCRTRLIHLQHFFPQVVNVAQAGAVFVQTKL